MLGQGATGGGVMGGSWMAWVGWLLSSACSTGAGAGAGCGTTGAGAGECWAATGCADSVAGGPGCTGGNTVVGGASAGVLASMTSGGSGCCCAAVSGAWGGVVSWVVGSTGV
ncbi:hypothetical protein ACFQ1L_12120 [Phytohabitans flavus]|uniref:hypothetical protein n=1 Tax=Phytohabitans flavus TaxID=1076124 RepID=UPI003637A942